jgi:hypothetical protein
VDANPRTAALSIGVFFCLAVAGTTVYFAASARLNVQTVVLTVIGLGIDLMILLGLIGAIRNPPE